MQQIDAIEGWQEDLAALHQRIAPRFARWEVEKEWDATYSLPARPLGRNNGWQMAEHLGEPTPDGVQRLLNAAQSDAEEARDDLRTYVLEHFAEPRAILELASIGEKLFAHDNP